MVREALVTVLQVPPARVRPDGTLSELAADSLVLVETAEIIEHLLAAGDVRVRIGDDDLARMTNVGQLVDYLAALV